MEALPSDILAEFMKGNHVMRHNPGIWNGVWSDMFIETTFMRYGHEAGGLVGLTLQPSAVSRWALSLHVCSQLRMDLSAMKDGPQEKQVTVHKEESNSRIKSDADDRSKLRAALSTFIDPLDVDSLPDGLVNIASGQISPTNVNADQAFEIGVAQMKDFQSGWPASFHKPLSMRVTTMRAGKKSISSGGDQVYDAELIYNRVLGLQPSRDLDIKDILRYELSPVPQALFDEHGDMRTQAKAVLKNKLQVEVSARHANPPDLFIIDGCAMLWSVHWPANGTVEDYIRNFLGSVNFYLKQGSVYLIFDRYPAVSIKNGIRSNRAGKEASRKHLLTLQTPLPTQKVVLTVTHNKKQLIQLISTYLVDHLVKQASKNELILTSEDPVPISVEEGLTTKKIDMTNTHEEADVIIVNQLVYAARHGSSNICIVCDDTDVFVLLVYFYCKEELDCSVTMQSPVAGRSVIDIKASSMKSQSISQNLPAMHALSGSDTTSYLFGIGKATAMKVLAKGQCLNLLGVEGTVMDDVVAEAASFISVCYGMKSALSMSELRYVVWAKKMANARVTSAPKLKNLPPTQEAFAQHVYRAHLQTMIWKSALCSAPPPAADPTIYGWTKKEDGQLTPVTLPNHVCPAPANVLQMIKCGCSSSTPCSTARCSCMAAQISCTMFCSCHAEAICNNSHTRAAISSEEDRDETSAGQD